MEQWLRVLGFTVPTVSLAILAHVSAGGVPPGVGVLALVYGSVALLCASLALRERRLPQLLAGVGVVQVAVHIALLDHHASTIPARSSVSPAMTAAHLAASLLLAWWLRRGEARLWRAGARALRSLFGVPAPSALPIAARLPAATPRAPRPRIPLLLEVPTLRGPPTPS